MSEAGRPLTVPKEFLSPPGDLNPTLLLFLSALAIIAISFVGYWYGDWPDCVVFR
jgi:beta-carotene hydroxylase